MILNTTLRGNHVRLLVRLVALAHQAGDLSRSAAARYLETKPGEQYYRRHRSRLSRHGADTRRIWRHVGPTFASQVPGPCFEAATRYWTTHFADPGTSGGHPDHVGPTTVALEDGARQQLDVVVAADDAGTPSERTALALGEARAGERITSRHPQRLEAARSALGDRAAAATLLLFGVRFAPQLLDSVARRTDVELIDLDRLHEGS